MTVEQRLDQLEKRNKRLTVGLTMIAVTICAVVTMAACEPETDKQSRRNNQQAELNELSERHLDLKIKQARQTLERAEGKFQSRAATELKNGHFESVTARRVYVTNDAGKTVITLSANASGDGLVEVVNKTGERIAQMGADEYGNGLVGAWNRKGEGRTLKPGP